MPGPAAAEYCSREHRAERRAGAKAEATARAGAEPPRVPGARRKRPGVESDMRRKRRVTLAHDHVVRVWIGRALNEGAARVQRDIALPTAEPRAAGAVDFGRRTRRSVLQALRKPSARL